MSARNGGGPPEDAADRVGRLKPGGGITPEAHEFLQRRTEGFQQATSGRGQPLTYGTGKPPAAKSKKAAKKDTG
jgi:hypothetical protein